MFGDSGPGRGRTVRRESKSSQADFYRVPTSAYHALAPLG